MTADGNTIVGTYGYYGSSRGKEDTFIWTAAGGFRDIREYLRDDVSIDVNPLVNVAFDPTVFISADGTTLTSVGEHTLNGYDRPESFVVHSVPEPAGLALLTAAGLAFLRRGGRRFESSTRSAHA